MANLIYMAITSLDLYVADENGNFDWANPDAEVHRFVNDLMRPIGTHLYGRRMYEVVVAWESDEILVDQPPFIHDFAAIWRAADKIVYSRSLESVSSARTRIELGRDEVADDISRRPPVRRIGSAEPIRLLRGRRPPVAGPHARARPDCRSGFPWGRFAPGLISALSRLNRDP